MVAELDLGLVLEGVMYLIAGIVIALFGMAKEEPPEGSVQRWTCQHCGACLRSQDPTMAGREVCCPMCRARTTVPASRI